MAPGFLRKGPDGWLAGRVFVTGPSLGQGEQHATGVYQDERASSFSCWLEGDFRIVVPGFEEHTFHDTRDCPNWLLQGGMAGVGKRWYHLRLKPHTGMVAKLGFPCLVNPANPSDIWIDWDASWAEHEEAWESEAAMKKAVAKKRGGFDGTMDRIFSNPFTRDVTPEEAALVDQRIAEEDAKAEEIRQRYIAQNEAAQASATDQGELTELRRREKEAERIFAEGRDAMATVKSNSVNGKNLAGISLVYIVFELHEDPPRRVGLEYSFGKRGAGKYPVGKTVKLKIDPDNPELVFPGE